jgi:hypothetical protein
MHLVMAAHAIAKKAITQKRRRPIGCNVKKESGAFSDEFSAGLVAGSKPPAWQRLMAPQRLCLHRRRSKLASAGTRLTDVRLVPSGCIWRPA